MAISAWFPAEPPTRPAKERYRRGCAAAGVAPFEVRPDGFLQAGSDFRRLLGLDPALRLNLPALMDRIHPEDRAAVGAQWNRLAVAGGAFDVEFRIAQPDGSQRWILLRGEAEAAMAGGRLPRSVTGIAMDDTARRAAVEERMMLARETEHRTKNTLAVVSSLLHLVPARDDGAACFAAALRDRIAALARTQGLLADGGASGTDLRALLEAELAPYAGQPYGGRTRLVGAPVDLPARLAQALTLALHELATNAAKYGALSAPTGTVEVMWWKERDRLKLRWIERGGPRLAGEPASGGFGSRLLDVVIRRQLGGDLSFDWSADGLCCEFSVDTGPRRATARPSPVRRGTRLRPSR